MGDVTSAPLAALGVDVGTTNTKVVLAVFGDAVREERTLTVPTPGTGAGLQAAVLGAIREVVLDSPHPVAAIGVASMGETGCLTAPDGEPLGHLLSWADGDTATMTVRYPLLGKTVEFQMQLLRRDGRWYSADAVHAAEARIAAAARPASPAAATAAP